MKKYKTLLFDIDDTLFDFSIDQKIAFKKAMHNIGYECTDEMYKVYNEINLSMWRMLDEGKISLKELYIKRFELFFERYKINESPKKFNKELDYAFQETGTPIEGVKDLLDYLKGDYELAITSNGPKAQQYHRLKNADFDKYFSKIFISEELGYNKPDQKYFDIVFDNIENKDKSSIMIIGDSLTSDIIGGNNAGIDTCWYNAKKITNTTKAKPTYEIKSYIELPVDLNIKFKERR